MDILFRLLLLVPLLLHPANKRFPLSFISQVYGILIASKYCLHLPDSSVQNYIHDVDRLGGWIIEINGLILTSVQIIKMIVPKYCFPAFVLRCGKNNILLRHTVSIHNVSWIIDLKKTFIRSSFSTYRRCRRRSLFQY